MPEPQIRELLDFIVRHLVDEPDAVEVCEVPGTRVTTYEIVVSDRDRGKVIGRQGRIANALRTVAKAAGTMLDQQIAVEIVT